MQSNAVSSKLEFGSALRIRLVLSEDDVQYCTADGSNYVPPPLTWLIVGCCLKRRDTKNVKPMLQFNNEWESYSMAYSP
jgi:hypothetical protein